VGVKIGLLYRKRAERAASQFKDRVQHAVDGSGDGSTKLPKLLAGADPWSAWQYAVDAAQRTILFWDTMRQRGNSFVEQTMRGPEPQLHFKYEMVLDGRGF